MAKSSHLKRNNSVKAQLKENDDYFWILLEDMPEFSTIATTKEFPIFWAENLSMV